MYQLVMLHVRVSHCPKVAGDLSDMFLACMFHITLFSHINILTSLHDVVHDVATFRNRVQIVTFVQVQRNVINYPILRSLSYEARRLSQINLKDDRRIGTHYIRHDHSDYVSDIYG